MELKVLHWPRDAQQAEGENAADLGGGGGGGGGGHISPQQLSWV